MLALLLESAASLQAADTEEKLAEALLDAIVAQAGPGRQGQGRPALARGRGMGGGR